ncbi:transposase [Microbulbifer sp. TRSA005]|uniref:transposase n=1 Tax=Microbulbifer sp. TRSA005 TaxID=3243383 RepID=UPI00403A1595
MSYYQLSEKERYQIYSLRKSVHSQKVITKFLERHLWTINRELQRNIGLQEYRPRHTNKHADLRRCHAYKVQRVADGLRLIRKELSPQQTAGYLKRHTSVSLHHETIYQMISLDQINVEDLYKHLRIASKPYRKRCGKYVRRGRIRNRESIDNRPAVVDKMKRIPTLIK